jgi:dolichyl-phosphate beta-glucosyltransferase
MFNEAVRIERSLLALEQAGLDGIRLILVDDGSSDATVVVAETCIARLGIVDASVLRLGANAGKGAAVRAGVLASNTPYVGFVDADLSLDPLEIRRALNRLHLTRGDIVVGERLVDPSVQPRLRRVASVVFRRVTELLAPTGVRDPQCALKFFRADVASTLFGHLETDGFAFDVEVLLRARQAGYVVDEMTVRWTHQPGSKVDPVRDSLRMFGELRRIGRRIKA